MSTGVTLVGAGALGQGLAAHLVRSGPTTLLARAATAERLRADGVLAVRGGAVTEAVRVETGPGSVRVVDDPADVPADDVVLFATKGPELPAVAAAVASHWPRGTGAVAGLQNGVAKDRVLAEVFGADAVVGAATVLGAKRADGEVLVTGLGATYLGEFGGPPSDRIGRLADRFTSAGLPCVVCDDIAGLLWTKCANALAAFGVSSLSRLASTSMMRREPLVRAFLDLLAEAAAVAAADGSPVGDYPDLPIASYLSRPADEVADELLARIRATAPPAEPAYSSMALDVLLGRPTEVGPVFGEVVERAARLGVAVPRLDLTARIVAGLTAAEA